MNPELSYEEQLESFFEDVSHSGDLYDHRGNTIVLKNTDFETVKASIFKHFSALGCIIVTEVYGWYRIYKNNVPVFLIELTDLPEEGLTIVVITDSTNAA